jgi:hypothetical protein
MRHYEEQTLLREIITHYFENHTKHTTALGQNWELFYLKLCGAHTSNNNRSMVYGLGRAIAQAVSRWLPTAAARVRARVWSCGIWGGQSGAGTGFLRVLRFPLPIFIPPISPQSPSSIIWGWYNRPVVAAVPSGLSLTELTIIITRTSSKSVKKPVSKHHKKTATNS